MASVKDGYNRTPGSIEMQLLFFLLYILEIEGLLPPPREALLCYCVNLDTVEMPLHLGGISICLKNYLNKNDCGWFFGC